MKKRFRLLIDRDRCKGCRLCVEFCPCGVLEMSRTGLNANGTPYVEVVAPDACTGCRSCALVCPDCVIEIAERTGNRHE